MRRILIRLLARRAAKPTLRRHNVVAVFRALCGLSCRQKPVRKCFGHFGEIALKELRKIPHPFVFANACQRPNINLPLPLLYGIVDKHRFVMLYQALHTYTSGTIRFFPWHRRTGLGDSPGESCRAAAPAEKSWDLLALGSAPHSGLAAAFAQLPAPHPLLRRTYMSCWLPDRCTDLLPLRVPPAAAAECSTYNLAYRLCPWWATVPDFRFVVPA